MFLVDFRLQLLLLTISAFALSKLLPPLNLKHLKAASAKFEVDDYGNRKIAAEAESLQGQKLIDYVNSHQTLWKAGPNKIASYSNRARNGFLGVKKGAAPGSYKKNLSPTRLITNIYIPDSFDSRIVWDKCQSIKDIRDQSACGSCWAFGAVEAMSDRTCIASKGKIQVSLSSDNLLSCCTLCGDGCEGGYSLYAWIYWRDHGIVTGSNYTANGGCQPYPLLPCEHHVNNTRFRPCKHELYATPPCKTKCQNGYLNSYDNDKHYGLSAYVVDSDVESIQKEIMLYGPVEAGFTVYSDFLSYKSGVYRHTSGSYDGGHAVKIIGWGTEGDVPYWLIANSWNSDWGEKGFFRILRGDDECGIESNIVAGLPAV